MLKRTPVALAMACSLSLPQAATAQDAVPPPPAPSPAARPSAEAGAAPASASATATPSAAITALAAGPLLDQVSVTATRTPRRLDDVPNTVTVTTADDIEREGARSIKDVFRNELDVTVRQAPTRFSAAGAATGRAGQEGINIRGLEGNQVLILVDGIRAPSAFSFGSMATGRGDFLNVDSAQTIEVLRGPASTQYGSDGLAGVVSLRTLDPADVLRPGQSVGGYAQLGYASVDRSWHTAVAVAARSGDWQALLLARQQRGHETDNQGQNDAPNATRTTPDPVDYSTPATLGKLIYSIGPTQQLGLTVEAQRRTQDTHVISARAAGTLAAASVLDLQAHDRVERERVSLEHDYEDPQGRWFHKAQTRLYVQDAEVRQLSLEDRNTSADRVRDNRYEQKVIGFSTLFERRIGDGPSATPGAADAAQSNALSALQQRWSFGVDASRSEISGVRDGTVPPAGETFPTRPFPDTRYTLMGAFVQDEIEAGRVSLIPGLRWDRYRLQPSADGYTGGTVLPLSDQALTPRLGAVWRLARGFAPYAQWARGFRAPAPDQVNNGFSNVTSGYRSIGNPNLKAERASSVELGARGRQGPLRWQVAVFDQRYRDFISQQVVGGSGTPADPSVFQYVNLTQAHIRGAELRTAWQIAPRWSLNAGSAYTRGDTQLNGVETPLATVEPLRATLGLRYEAETLAFNATALHSQAKSPGRTVPIATTTGTAAAFATPSYTVLDLGARWKPTSQLTLNANLNNVFDKTYWRWSDVRGLADSSTVRDAYTAPGRELQVSVRYDF